MHKQIFKVLEPKAQQTAMEPYSSKQNVLKVLQNLFYFKKASYLPFLLTMTPHMASGKLIPTARTISRIRVSGTNR